MPKEEVATICFFKDLSTSVEKVSHDIKILTTNGNIKANRCLLRMASPVVHRNLKHNEKADVLDLMDYSVETVTLLVTLKVRFRERIKLLRCMDFTTNV